MITTSTLLENNLSGVLPASWSALANLRTLSDFIILLLITFCRLIKNLFPAEHWMAIIWVDHFLQPGLPSAICEYCMFFFNINWFNKTNAWMPTDIYNSTNSLAHFPPLGLLCSICNNCTFFVFLRIFSFSNLFNHKRCKIQSTERRTSCDLVFSHQPTIFVRIYFLLLFSSLLLTPLCKISGW